jgi:hypothetical protein
MFIGLKTAYYKRSGQSIEEHNPKKVHFCLWIKEDQINSTPLELVLQDLETKIIPQEVKVVCTEMIPFFSWNSSKIESAFQNIFLGQRKWFQILKLDEMKTNKTIVEFLYKRIATLDLESKSLLGTLMNTFLQNLGRKPGAIRFLD